MDWPGHYDRFFSSLKMLRGGGNQKWSAQCPAHEDAKPSLSIALGTEGKLLVRCCAPHQCSLNSIARAVGLEPKDFFPPWSSTVKEKYVTSYLYRDAEGKELFQVCRFEGTDEQGNKTKTFRQRRLNPSYDSTRPRTTKDSPVNDNPEFIYDTAGVKRVLYRLPELLASLKESPKRWVFVVEGEKSVDAIREAGGTATCNPMGALKWQEEYGKHFTGCNVVVVPDEDPFDPKAGYSPGLRHAFEVASNLKHYASTVRVVRCPGVGPKGDYDAWAALQTDCESKKDRFLRFVSICKTAPLWDGKELEAIYGLPAEAKPIEARQPEAKRPEDEKPAPTMAPAPAAAPPVPSSTSALPPSSPEATLPMTAGGPANPAHGVGVELQSVGRIAEAIYGEMGGDCRSIFAVAGGIMMIVYNLEREIYSSAILASDVQHAPDPEKVQVLLKHLSAQCVAGLSALRKAGFFGQSI